MAFFVRVLVGIVLLGGATQAREPVADPAPASRPNIVFIFSDDHAAQAISAYGSKLHPTPNLDRIAAEGMRFDHCFCTNSICGPSRAVVLTGKHSHLNGFQHNGQRFDGSQDTFPKRLQAAGYETAVIGKWHLGTTPTGFDHWETLYGQGPYYQPEMDRDGTKVAHQGYTSDIITDLAVRWLTDTRDEERPFLLMVQHKAPHRNWQPAERHLDLFADRDLPEPPTLFDDYSNRGTAARIQDMTIEETLTDFDLKFTFPNRLTESQRGAWDAAYGPRNASFEASELTGAELVRWKYQRYIKDYLRCIQAVDEGVGQLLDTLEAEGLAENTIVIYSSDQGFYLGEHGWFDKRFMYEESLRMPLLVRWPGTVPAGSVHDALVSNLDFADTFCELAGAERVEGSQGESLVPLLRGELPEEWRTSVYYHYYEYFEDYRAAHLVRRHCGVRTDRYKLIHFYNLDEWELYDLGVDPLELVNRADDPAYAEVRAALEKELRRLQQHYEVPDDTGSVSRDPHGRIAAQEGEGR